MSDATDTISTVPDRPAHAHEIDDLEAGLAAAEQRRAAWNAAEDAFRKELAQSEIMKVCFQAARQVKSNEACAEMGREKNAPISNKECYLIWGTRIKAFVSVLEERSLLDFFLGLQVPDNADPDYKLGAAIVTKAVRLARSESAEAVADFLLEILDRTPEFLTAAFAMGSGWFSRAFDLTDNEARRRWPAVEAGCISQPYGRSPALVGEVQPFEPRLGLVTEEDQVSLEIERQPGDNTVLSGSGSNDSSSEPPAEAGPSQPENRRPTNSPVSSRTVASPHESEHTTEHNPFRRGPQAKKANVAKRNELIAEAIQAGKTTEEEIFNYVRQHDSSLLFANKKGSRLINPKSMMTAYNLAMKAKQKCSSL